MARLCSTYLLDSEKPFALFLELSHTKLDVFRASKQFVVSCYQELKSFPNEEKFGIVRQIQRAAFSVHLNIAEGCTRKSMAERKRFYEVARGSLIEVDAALDVCVELNYSTKDKLKILGQLMSRIFHMISKMIKDTDNT